MEKYFELDPDEGSWFIYISDLTETQHEFISKLYDDIEDNEDEDEYKYVMDVPGDYYGDTFSNIMKYLKEEGFENVGSYKYGY